MTTCLVRHSTFHSSDTCSQCPCEVVMQPSFEQHVLRVNSPADAFYHVFYDPDVEVSLSQPSAMFIRRSHSSRLSHRILVYRMYLLHGCAHAMGADNSA